MPNSSAAAPSGEEDYHHPMDVEEFRKQAYAVVDFICDYHKSLEQLPVLSSTQPGYLQALLPQSAPAKGQPFQEILRDVRDKIMPGMTHWQSPNFFAYFPANSSFPGLLGELLSGAFNIIGFSWRGCPAATDLETIVLDWYAKLLHLPATFLATQPDGSRGKGGGVIQGTASEATLVALLAARAKALLGRPAEDGVKLVVYSSDQAHSSIKKATMVAGITHCRLLKTHKEDDWTLRPDALREAVLADRAAGLLPFYLVGTVGTTSSCACDPLRALGAIAQELDLWFHVDAAYAGAAAILPEYHELFDGLELADSFCTNAHKWMLTNFDCSCFFVTDSKYLKLALSLSAAYYKNTTNEYDYKDWQIPLGRRFRALKLWFVLRSYGADGLREYLQHHIRLAEIFTERIIADDRFRLAARPRLSLVCFMLQGGSREQNVALLDAVNASGKAFLVHTELGEEFVLRLAIGSASTQMHHIDAVWNLLCKEADKVLARG